eukprot:3901645-Rhodomonas_salina.1
MCIRDRVASLSPLASIASKRKTHWPFDDSQSHTPASPQTMSGHHMVCFLRALTQLGCVRARAERRQVRVCAVPVRAAWRRSRRQRRASGWGGGAAEQR